VTHALIVALSVLGVVGQVLVGILLLAGLLWLVQARGPLAWIRAAVWGYELWLVFLVSAIATLGSLFFSEIAGFVPCELCWYQRIAMYPLVVILAIAAVRRDRDVWHYVVPLAGIGAAISTYHYLVEWFPEADSGVCKSTVPCTFVWFRELGFVSLPLMALCGFALIITLVTLPQEEA